MKKFTLLFVVVIALLSSVIIAASAEDTSNLVYTMESSDSVVYSQTEDTPEGEEFDVVLKIEKNDGFLMSRIEVVYDINQVEYVSYDAANSVIDVTELSVVPDQANGKIVITIDDFSNAMSAAVKHTATGELLTFTFKAVDGAEDQVADIAVVANPKNTATLNKTTDYVIGTNPAQVQIVKGDDHTHTPDESLTVLEKEANCTETGNYIKTCTVCTLEYDVEIPIDEDNHEVELVPGQDPDCENPGFEDCYSCVRCETYFVDADYTTLIGDEAAYEAWKSADGKIVENGHTEGAVVVENAVAPKCDVDGSYDNVTYCTVCGEQLSRETVKDPMLGHTPGATQIENVKAPDCVNDGSHDEVVYCTVENCGKEISRITVVDAALGHTEGETVVEN